MAALRQASCVAILLVAVVASFGDARTLKQASPPYVSPEDLTEAIQRINFFAQVPDTAPAVALSPNYEEVVNANQGPAASIVEASYELTADEWSETAQEQSTALWSFGYQTGTSGLSEAGKRLYDAYQAITNALGFTQ